MAYYSNGTGFSYVPPSNYTTAMIQASDGEFVSATIRGNFGAVTYL